MPRTKIICTIGPAVDGPEKLKKLVACGMDVARLNFSHGTHEEHAERIRCLKEIRQETKRPLAIMLDTKGPEVRIGEIEGGEICLAPGHRLRLTAEVLPGNAERVTVLPGSVLAHVKVGMTVLFDDGYIASHVVDTSEGQVTVEIDNGGILRSLKGVNIPQCDLKLPSLTDRDLDDLKFGCEQGVDLVAASFVGSAADVIRIKRALKEFGKPDIPVIAKIESSQGIANFDNILQVVDGIMVARGDLGVEVSLSEVPRLQKMMIRKCYRGGKPAVTATQMLESMISNPRPTRAEASDVANAIYDSTSCLMLSGETAVGKYPFEAVSLMRKIAEETEKDLEYKDFFHQSSNRMFRDIASSLTLAAVKTAYSSNAKAIFVFTTSGTTARLISRWRPEMPVLAMTNSEERFHQMAFVWGVTPVFCAQSANWKMAHKAMTDYALEKGIVQYGDLVVIIAGRPFGITGTTNMMMVESIGDVLVRGDHGVGKVVTAEVVIALFPEDKAVELVKDRILVVPRCDETYLPMIREASGLIVQNHLDDLYSEQFALRVGEEWDIPVIVRADFACSLLKDHQQVTLDPQHGLVFRSSSAEGNPEKID